MPPEQRRIVRLRRLERVRAIAKRTAAADAAQAEGVLQQLNRLSERTASITQEYLARDDALNGFELGQTARFVAGLLHVAAHTGIEASTARVHADRKLAQLAEAERRRDAVAKRADVAERLLAKHTGQPALGARRKFGTELE